MNWKLLIAAGLAAWLLFAVIASAVASFLPAWQASELTVAQVLAYE